MDVGRLSFRWQLGTDRQHPWEMKEQEWGQAQTAEVHADWAVQELWDHVGVADRIGGKRAMRLILEENPK